MPMERALKRMAIVLAIIITLLAVYHYGINAFIRHMIRQPQPPVTISTVVAKSADWQPHLTTIGEIKAAQGVTLAAETANSVTQIYFKSGDTVKKDELLITINDEVERAELKSNQANLTLNKLTFDRFNILRKQGNVSQKDFDEASANLQKAEADVQRVNAMLNLKNIKAPFSGRLGIWQVDTGEYVNPGSPLVNLQALDPILVRFSLPEQEIPQLQTGQEVLVNVDAYPKTEFSGKINAIDAKIAADTHTVMVEANTPNPKGLLYPGMFAKVQVLLPIHKQVIHVPTSAITNSLYGDSVFVVVEQGKNKDGKPAYIAERRFVTLGLQQGDQVEIVKGVKAGEQVVNAGQLKLQDKSPVVINNENPLDQKN
jgi:membrane fusion protein (multidrug efflux system)